MDVERTWVEVFDHEPDKVQLGTYDEAAGYAMRTHLTPDEAEELARGLMSGAALARKAVTTDNGGVADGRS